MRLIALFSQIVVVILALAVMANFALVLYEAAPYFIAYFYGLAMTVIVKLQEFRDKIISAIN
jgi:hypothetical protein